MRCAISTRVSTAEQALSEYSSLKRQEGICRNYIDIHAEKGWKAATRPDRKTASPAAGATVMAIIARALSREN